jgi:protein gp37
MAETSIEWTDATWNPIAGCTVLTAGCTNCYAMRMAARLEAMGTEKYRGLTRKSGGRAVWTGKIRLDEKSLALGRSRARFSSTRCPISFTTMFQPILFYESGR